MSSMKNQNSVSYDLSQLVEEINPENIHSEYDFGQPVGKEWEDNQITLKGLTNCILPRFLYCRGPIFL